jgi:uncharacterized protein YdiU (UPF0061 family)
MNKIETKVDAGWNLDNSYSLLPKTFFSRIDPTPVRLPKLIVLNEPLAVSLGLDVQALRSNAGVATLAGNLIPPGSLPLAQAYAGHQFGHFTMLGDGRALLLGEQIASNRERFDIQLKGSGETPYSRRGDGRAALGPMLREYIISEAMHGLGIATTRSLAVVTTGETVLRDTEQPGAVLTRVAASHLRVGTFQYVATRGTLEELRALADYTINRHFPTVEAEANRYLLLLQEVIRRQAALIAQWQLVGFVHGVMNTDNMALAGETIDYGPCAFMDVYDPKTVFSSIDTQGRYAYENQPDIAGWNLARFAEALLPLLHVERLQAIRLAQEAVASFPTQFQYHWLAGMRAKLGIFNEEPEDEALIQGLLGMMQRRRADYTNTFRSLAFDRPGGDALSGSEEFSRWSERWQARLGRQQQTKQASQQLMQQSNPERIPRNHRVEEALEAAVLQADYSVMNRLLEVLARPFAHLPEYAEYADPSPSSNLPYRTFCGT